MSRSDTERTVRIPSGGVELDATLAAPDPARGLVIFAHGSGSSRHSPRNRAVSRSLNDAGFETLLMDLLTSEEERVDISTAELRFDIPLLAHRLVDATRWARAEGHLPDDRAGYFGASTGAAAALVAAAEVSDLAAAVVSRGGRPDLAGAALAQVRAPTLLIVGGDDHNVIGMNSEARAQMSAPCELEVIPGAGHLFEEPGALERVAELARAWFARHLVPG